MLRVLSYSLILILAIITFYLKAFNTGYAMGYFNGVFDVNFKHDFDSWKVIEEYLDAEN